MQIVIMRGLPGSGKSTNAQALKIHAENSGWRVVICSNDDYPGYYPEGVYAWTPERAKEAKRWCQEKFLQAIKDGVEFIIVDNTNLNEKSYGFYQKTGEAHGYDVAFNTRVPQATVEYIRTCASRNKHGVTEAMLYNMLKAWNK